MPLPRAVARFNRFALNRVVRRIAPRMPGLGLVVHVGRRSGREFRTPVNVFTADGRVTIALTYGPQADWVRNVLAAHGCTLITRGRALHLVDPRIVHDATRAAMPPVVRQLLGVLRVADFLVLDEGP